MELEDIQLSKDDDGDSITTFSSSANEDVSPDSIKSENAPLRLDDVITKWRPILVAGLVYFLCSIEAALCAISEWPYMHTIDKDASLNFFGTTLAIASWAHVVFSLVFSLWNYRFQTVKWPLIIGRIFATLGSILYIMVEVFPTNRRFVMLTCYIVFSIAASSTVVIRIYIVLNSSELDRPRAVAIISLANVLSFVAGPLIQLAFSMINYPGWKLLPGININLFSAPIWVATLLNILSVPLIIFGFPEMEKEKRNFQNTFSLGFIKKKWNTIRSLNVPWIFVFIVLFERFTLNTALSTVQQAISPMCISVWGMSNRETVTWISAGMGSVGTLAIITSIIFITSPLSRILRSRSTLVISFALTLLMYLLAFPYPFLSQDVATYNETSRTGCNPDEYSWCSSTRAPYVWVWMIIVIGAMGLALPTGTIATDSIYSKVVGEASQSLMQGLLVLMDDIVNIGGPVYVSETFTSVGPTIFWVINWSIAALGAIIWAIVFRWMKPY